MLWKVVNAAITTQFSYEPPKEAKDAWINMTGRAWDNLEDSIEVKVRCPKCANFCNIPWTTCGLPENNTSTW